MDNKRLLIIDDDESIRFNMKLYLEDEGFECFDVRDAESALRLLTHEGFSLSIVDIRLPGVNGEEYIKRSNTLNPRMKYLIHTGNTQYILPNDLIKLGINPKEVFYKPLTSFDIIVNRIRQLL